jgi:hypothetical protein
MYDNLILAYIRWASGFVLKTGCDTLLVWHQVEGVGYSESKVEIDATALQFEISPANLELETDATGLELETDVSDLELEIDVP